MVCHMKPPSTPRYDGANLVVDLDEEEYRRGIENLKFSVATSTKQMTRQKMAQ